MSLGGYPVDSQVVHRTLFLHNMEGVSDPSMEIESEQEVEWNSPYTTTVARGYSTKLTVSREGGVRPLQQGGGLRPLLLDMSEAN